VTVHDTDGVHPSCRSVCIPVSVLLFTHSRSVDRSLNIESTQSTGGQRRQTPISTARHSSQIPTISPVITPTLLPASVGLCACCALDVACLKAVPILPETRHGAAWRSQVEMRSAISSSPTISHAAITTTAHSRLALRPAGEWRHRTILRSGQTSCSLLVMARTTAMATTYVGAWNLSVCR
jgi:hypothetical protein